jgi:aminoglycoside phosphotransferase (APT) family kinase protein
MVGEREAVGWLPDPSIQAIRAALAVVAPELAEEPIRTAPRIPGNPPSYWRGTARVGERFVAKFAWSREAAIAVNRELDTLILLRKLAPSIPVPEVVLASRDPLLFVSRYVAGVPGGDPYAEDTTPSAIPEQLAAVLAALHDPTLMAHLKSHGAVLGETQPQATTSTLRERFVGPIIDGAQAPRVLSWCDWIDDLQRRPAPDTTTVHGDLHAHNFVISEDGERLLLVADFESAAFGDPHYDFRYLVSIRHDLAWFTTCLEAYQKLSQCRLSIDRILAWHILTALGDALWRTELGVPLPGNLTPADYVEDITWRLAELGTTIA